MDVHTPFVKRRVARIIDAILFISGLLLVSTLLEFSGFRLSFFNLIHEFLPAVVSFVDFVHDGLQFFLCLLQPVR
jgi:hypothetical protein